VILEERQHDGWPMMKFHGFVSRRIKIRLMDEQRPADIRVRFVKDGRELIEIPSALFG